MKTNRDAWKESNMHVKYRGFSDMSPGNFSILKAFQIRLLGGINMECENKYSLGIR